MKHFPLFRKLFIYTFLYAVSASIVVSIFLLRPTSHNSFPVFRAVIIFFSTVLLTKYFIYMVISPVYDVWVARRDKKFQEVIRAYRPKVSVIIPAWNERVGIIGTVRSLLANTYENLEIVIVNDGSTDDSDRIIRNFLDYYKKFGSADHPGKTIIYQYKQNEGKGAALNDGISLSTGEIIVSIDADCYVMPNTIQNFVKCFADPRVMAAVGNVKIGNTRTLIGTIQYLEYLFSFYFKKADSLMNTIYIIGGAAGAFRRILFEKIGPYNTKNITEDIELSVRIQGAGMRIVYAADAVVFTEGATDVRSLRTQRVRWKRGRFQTFWEHRNLFFNYGKKHNKLLTYAILPLALFCELQLFCEILFIIFMYAYAYWTNDFSSFISGIIVVSSMFIVQTFSDEVQTKKFGFFLLAPIGWLLFYLPTFVEYVALLKSIVGSLRRQRITWQTWQRNGVHDT